MHSIYLAVTNPDGGNTITKARYINVDETVSALPLPGYGYPI
jgi:hypothetical protein